MKKYLSTLQQTQLFAGIKDEEITSMLSCLNGRLRSYRKGEYVLRQGEQFRDLLVLLEGSLHLRRDDYWGNRSLLQALSAGEAFGEAYAAPESAPLRNDVVAVENSTVIFFDVKRILTTCPSACRHHTAVMQNLFFAICEKNQGLEQKLSHLTRRSTREKLLSYLSDEAQKQGCASFTSPFNRQELADYLSVDRSAMSNELCKMRRDGLLTFEKNHFRLL